MLAIVKKTVFAISFSGSTTTNCRRKFVRNQTQSAARISEIQRNHGNEEHLVFWLEAEIHYCWI